jgi:hypothetical protein
MQMTAAYTAEDILGPLRECDPWAAEALEDMAEVLADELSKRHTDKGADPSQLLDIPTPLLGPEILGRGPAKWYDLVPLDNSKLLAACAIRLDQTCSEVLEDMRALFPPNHTVFMWMIAAYQAWEEADRRKTAVAEAAAAAVVGAAVAAMQDTPEAAQIEKLKREAQEAQKVLAREQKRDQAKHGTDRQISDQIDSLWRDMRARDMSANLAAKRIHELIPPRKNGRKHSVATIRKKLQGKGNKADA